MPSEITLLEAPDGPPLENGLQLGEVIAPLNLSDNFYGEPFQINAKNSGDTQIRELSAGVDGEGASCVQLANDMGGEPGVWADTGQEILISSGTIFSRETFSFWARGVFTAEDAEGFKDFQIVFRGVSVG